MVDTSRGDLSRVWMDGPRWQCREHDENRIRRRVRPGICSAHAFVAKLRPFFGCPAIRHLSAAFRIERILHADGTIRELSHVLQMLIPRGRLLIRGLKRKLGGHLHPA